MKITRALTVTAATTFVVSVLSSPAAAAPSAIEQVQLATNWFTGLFDNQAQVEREPSVPFITMENCGIEAASSSPTSKYVHLEQYIGGPDALLRSSAYQFSAANRGVDLSVFSYLDREAALGTCDQAMPMLDLSNLVMPSCDVPLSYKPGKFVGTNDPEGCPTNFPAPGSTVVSSITLMPNEIASLDKFILASGDSFGTPIEFRRVDASTFEPDAAVAIGLVGLIGTLNRRRKD